MGVFLGFLPVRKGHAENDDAPTPSRAGLRVVRASSVSDDVDDSQARRSRW
jgi:hypothetical protein